MDNNNKKMATLKKIPSLIFWDRETIIYPILLKAPIFKIQILNNFQIINSNFQKQWRFGFTSQHAGKQMDAFEIWILVFDFWNFCNEKILFYSNELFDHIHDFIYLSTQLSIHELYSTRAGHFVVYERNGPHPGNIVVLMGRRFVAML